MLDASARSEICRTFLMAYKSMIAGRRRPETSVRRAVREPGVVLYATVVGLLEVACLVFMPFDSDDVDSLCLDPPSPMNGSHLYPWFCPETKLASGSGNETLLGRAPTPPGPSPASERLSVVDQERVTDAPVGSCRRRDSEETADRLVVRSAHIRPLIAY